MTLQNILPWTVLDTKPHQDGVRASLLRINGLAETRSRGPKLSEPHLAAITAKTWTNRHLLPPQPPIALFIPQKRLLRVGQWLGKTLEDRRVFASLRLEAMIGILTLRFQSILNDS